MGNRQYDMIIIGGGAAGLTAAIKAAKSGVSVLVLDHHTEPAAKILSTGNGRCNLTNSDASLQHYHCPDPAFVRPALERFGPADTLSFFRNDLHILCREKNGYWYPRTNQAVTVRDALLSACKRTGVRIKTEIGIRRVEQTPDGFLIDSKSGRFHSRCCILCCGGKAFAKSGSDGSGFVYARQLGHTVSPLLPALVPLYTEKNKLASLAGVRADASVTLYADGSRLAADCGEIQFRDFGISGIPVFQVSRYAGISLQEGKQVTAVIDLVPEAEEEDLAAFIGQTLPADSSCSRNLLFCQLEGLLHPKLCRYFEHEMPRTPKKAGTEAQVRRLASAIKHLKIPILKTGDFTQAQTTAGGVSTKEIDPETMQSLLVPGLFFAGEMIDVDGACGGYNLQWAWASAHLAAQGALHACR